ncbi:MAG: hypothetical protein ABFD89_01520 [Bryobacteraceae bacterium]
MTSVIARVFPRRTSATPTDELAFVGGRPTWMVPTSFRIKRETPYTLVSPDLPVYGMGITAVHVSVAFTWDLPAAERIAREWERMAPVQIGGPATGELGEEFVPGRYLRHGYVITSRGCPNRCWFCGVWRREGGVRELPIADGWNVLDDNLLACSEGHIRSVFAMLERVKASGRRIKFTGGLEAARLEDWHVEALDRLRPKVIYMAYDEPADLEPLIAARAKLDEADFTRETVHCYVLIGQPGDTITKAQDRLVSVWNMGMIPMAMLWRDKNEDREREWERFQREWVIPSIIKANMRRLTAV